MVNKNWLVALAVVATACSNSSNDVPDARHVVVDAGVDASSAPADAFIGPVSLKLEVNNTPVVGETVVFQAGDNTLLATETTDNNGVATADVPAGTTVTATPSFEGLNPFVVSVEGMAPGETAAVPTQVQGGGSTSITITVPLDENASSYAVELGCNSDNEGGLGAQGAGPSFELSLSGCGSQTGDLLMLEFDAQNTLLGSIYLSGVSLAADLDESGITTGYTAPVNFTVALTDVPDSIADVGMDVFLSSSSGELWDAIPMLNSDTNMAVVSMPDVDGSTWSVRTSGLNSNVAEIIVQSIAPAASYSLDVAATLTPAPSNFAFTESSRKLTWSEASPANADYVGVVLQVTRADSSQFTWVTLAPYDRQGITLPLLPTGNAANLLSTDTVQIGQAFLGSLTGGFAAALPDISDSFSGFSKGDLPVGSTLVLAGNLGH